MLASRLGVNVSTVSRLEAGITRRFDEKLLRRLERIFGVADIRRADAQGRSATRR